MVNPAQIESFLSSVRIYCDGDARLRDQFGKLVGGNEFKAIHDELYQKAIDLKLASLLTLTNRHGNIKGFHDKCSTHLKRAQWWPAYQSESNRWDILSLQLRPLAQAPLGSNWKGIRSALEIPPAAATIWNDDPTLAFSPFGDSYFCRTACLGHEGWTFYFVYGSRERNWEDAIVAKGIRFSGHGEAAYRELVMEPGKLAGRQ